ncbi:uncharacterized protein C3orf38 homolog isoform X2 [Teleopsis dalmanni]|uniref:uncharacterized protein C3orf38 homolog isoform X2 n=1 Tax=Teleopsis dalmanni TaxID=139649 RepID=UPI0018CE7C81|nr:uncharacterized protein C3orf38 homolog isoform X2 [Teleopsis dalmanni]
MDITDQEKAGFSDLFITEEKNQSILWQLAKSFSKNECNATKPEVNDSITILNKRYVTKEVLFKYLHKRNVQVSLDFTKLALIQSTLAYWKSNNLTDVKETIIEKDVNSVLAHTFSKWFFQRYNDETLNANDFYADAQLTLQLVDGDRINEKQITGASNVLHSLLDTKHTFQIYFHPNFDNDGCQGCVDMHGLVIVLICGTLHKQEICIGVFECTFGLLRDPFAENNYKIKTIKSCFRSQAISPNLSLKELE